MLELIICCFFVFAVAYWVTLWTAGRRDDVLHGDFVEGDPKIDPKAAVRPAIPASPGRRPAAARPAFPKKPVIAAPAPPPARVETSDSLQSLLASIKHELKNASQI
jgi:hypothetical protein